MTELSDKIRFAVKKAINQAGITQAELLRKTGINQPYFSAWINGTRNKNISIDKLASIADAIGIKLSYLIGMAENEK